MLTNIRQIVPQEACLKCDVCCRYPEKTTSLVPCFLEEEAEPLRNTGKLRSIGKKLDLKTPPIEYKENYACSFFCPERKMCDIYAMRPLDCRIYPFMVTYDKDSKAIVLTLDTKCPYLRDKLEAKEVMEYAGYLTKIFESDKAVEELNSNKNFINEYQEDSVTLTKLENISKRFLLSGYGLKKISLKDKAIFDEYFLDAGASLSLFAFEPIFIWSGILHTVWKEINGDLCVFAGNDRDYFLLLPPIPGKSQDTVKECLEILASLNEGGVSQLRIENVPQEFCEAMESRGLKVRLSAEEYLYSQKDLAELKGDKYKNKRALVNNFTKKYNYGYRKLEIDDIFGCLDLYGKWAEQKPIDVKDDYFRYLLEDSYFAQKTALFNFGSLNLEGRVVEVNGNIEGYTVGYPLNKETFVILFETINLSLKGLAQFIFREFCHQLRGYEYINTLSASGISNLTKSKDSYRPIKKIPSYTAFLEDGLIQ